MIVHNAVLSPLSPFLLTNSASAEKRRNSKETEALRSGNALLPVRSKKGRQVLLSKDSGNKSTCSGKMTNLALSRFLHLSPIAMLSVADSTAFWKR